MSQLINYILKPLNYGVIVLLCFSCEEKQMFQSLPSHSTGVHFVNEIEEREDFNILEYLYMYNGGGVAIGDVNNDGLQDIYFTANQKSNKLYLNKDGLEFEDVTETAGVGGSVTSSTWTTGVTMVDINFDGWLDIYVCKIHGFKGLNGGNQLYVNNGDGTFTEQAQKYGLDARSYAQQAAFFDYDLDGDLDMYLLNQAVHTPNSYKRGELRVLRDSLAGDRLYENQENFYVDISEKAGIYGGSMGYGLAMSIGDINNDNYPDIYVANDFHENDYLYYNQGNGTFEEKIRESIGHTSTFSMGNDLADINNDGWLDLITLDMRPDDEVELKKLMSAEDYDLYQFKLNHFYHFQYPRNMLQINRGNLFNEDVRFSETGEFAGVSATDWSWGALFADFDLDGRKDLFISNGIPRRPNDLDFINFTSNETFDPKSQDYLSVISLMPEGEASNVAYKNTGNKFEDVSEKWGLNLKGYSNGAAYADLDNDGDLDLVVNNLNARASFYENTVTDQADTRFIKVKAVGPQRNPQGIGARVSIEVSGTKQVQELSPVKGWLSTMDQNLIFGVGSADKIDKLVVNWKDGKGQVLENLEANQVVTLKYSDAAEMKLVDDRKTRQTFKPVDVEAGIDFRHIENDYIDFEYEKLIPRMISHEGPKIAVGDVNNDGLDDFYIGGAKNQSGKLYVQRAQADKIFEELVNDVFYKDRIHEDAHPVFIDVDLDGFLDLYVVSGSGEPFQDFTQGDRLYINDGTGQFVKSNQHPKLDFNGSCAVVGDINQDGIQDIFVGARSVPGSYGLQHKSRILLGDGSGSLFDATSRALGDKIKLGMVTDAVWLDNTKELIVVGEWMPITILSFRDAKIEEKKLDNTSGWWNTIHAADIDGDGDQDLLIGNMGTNSNLAASIEYPVSLYVKDFDNNSSIDPILSYYRDGVEYPYYGLDELAHQLVAVKKVYRSYETYAKSTFKDVFPIEELKGAGRRQVQTFESLLVENNGDGNFTATALPQDMQTAPIYGFATEDFDGDKNQDILAVGNFYGNQVNMGKYDASYGHFLKGEGIGNWKSVNPLESGFAVDGEARDIKILKSGGGKKLILVSRNNAGVRLFSCLKE